jgi:hypothetical protein
MRFSTSPVARRDRQAYACLCSTRLIIVCGFCEPFCMQKRQSLAGQRANATTHFVAAVDLLPGLWVQNHGRQTRLQRRLSAIPCGLYCRHVIHGAEVSLLKNHTAHSSIGEGRMSCGIVRPDRLEFSPLRNPYYPSPITDALATVVTYQDRGT